MKDLFLVIDMQNVYAKGGEWYCPSIDNTVEWIIQVINSNRATTAFTRYIAKANPIGTWLKYNDAYRDINNNSFANDVLAELKPYTNELNVYDKDEYSSLKNEDIKKMAFDTIGKSSVVISGVVAECCVLSTVMGLIDMGCEVIYLKDAVAGIDHETESAVLKILSGLDPMHVRCMTTKEYLDESYLLR